MLAHQDTISPGELLAPRAPWESLTPIADALFPPLPWDFAALPEWKGQTRLLSRFAMRWHAARKRLQRTFSEDCQYGKVLTAHHLPSLSLRNGFSPEIRAFLDAIARSIVRDVVALPSVALREPGP